MIVVFVSHASDDQVMIDEFVDVILRNGCGLEPGEIFYSSGSDTGVPDGEDLLSYVRAQVSDTGLVVAMLTPTFQTRPVCVAELGAAWAHTGKLFPLLVPGMNRSELVGVLSTQRIERMDDEGALDRLHDKIIEAADRRVQMPTWTRAKRRWLDSLHQMVEDGLIASPTAVTVDEHRKITEERDALADALTNAEEELRGVRAELAAVAALKNAAEVAEVRFPTKASERFESRLKVARKCLRELRSPRIAEAILAESTDMGGLPLPTDDPDDRRRVLDLVHQGLLKSDDELVWASDAFPEHESARQAVERAKAEIVDDPAFEAWFAAEFGAYPHMENLEALRRVFLP